MDAAKKSLVKMLGLSWDTEHDFMQIGIPPPAMLQSACTKPHALQCHLLGL